MDLYLKDQFTAMSWNEYKTKNEDKIATNKYRYFSNKIFLQSIDSLFQFLRFKGTMLKDLKLKDIMYQKAQSKITIKNRSIIINGKTFMTKQLILI